MTAGPVQLLCVRLLLSLLCCRIRLLSSVDARAADHILLMTVSYKPSIFYKHHQIAPHSILSRCLYVPHRVDKVGLHRDLADYSTYVRVLHMSYTWV